MQIVSRNFATSSGSIQAALDAWWTACALFATQPDEHGSVPLAFDMSTVDAARSGDENAFRQLLEHYQPTISKQMRRFSRDPDLVETLVHDVFVEAFMSLESFTGRSPFEHWLRKVAVRVGYRHWKTEARDKRRLAQLRDTHKLAPQFFEAPTAAIDAHEQLHTVLALLGPRDRLVLTLLYWDGLSVAEAAQLAGWTQTMVKVQAHRARRRLKNLLERPK